MSARIPLVFLAIVLFVGLSRSPGIALDAPGPRKDDVKAPEPKQFTLQADKVMLSQAIEELTRQTGIHVKDVRGVPDAAIRLDLKKATFWQALDAIAAAGDARIRLYPTSGRIVLDKRGASYRQPPISYDGRFRLSLTKMTAVRDLEIRETDPDHAAYTAAIEVAWDPELQPLFLETRPHGVRLVDDKKHVITVSEEGSSLAPVDGLIALGIEVRLPALTRSVAQINTLEGELSMIGPSKMLAFTFESLDMLAQRSSNDPERKQVQEGVTCHIRKVILDRQRWTIQVVLDYPPGMKQLDSNQSWVVNNQMTLVSCDGKKRFASSEYALEMATAQHAILSYHFRDKGGMVRGKAGDWTLRYRTPANLIEMPIKFAFKDIPLP
ncbi:MAG TPA: hypothetical protein VN688_27210 [Gemmataceae bacterium]|nr:hypothetical protein [Gemmataceae bacterium]